MDEICYLVSGKFATKEFMVLVPVKKADIDEVEFFGILKKYICKKLENILQCYKFHKTYTKLTINHKESP